MCKVKLFYLAILSMGLNLMVQAQEQDTLLLSLPDPMMCLQHDTIVQTFPEKSARFQEGDLLHFHNYIMQKVRYPREALAGFLSGRVMVSFVVDWDGNVRDVQVYHSSGYPVLDKEAVRVVKASPRWTPARNDENCVPQQLYVPIGFYNLGVGNWMR